MRPQKAEGEKAGSSDDKGDNEKGQPDESLVSFLHLWLGLPDPFRERPVLPQEPEREEEYRDRVLFLTERQVSSQTL